MKANGNDALTGTVIAVVSDTYVVVKFDTIPDDVGCAVDRLTVVDE